MAGLYIHIPFCKKACYYCNFHFSTDTRYKEQMITMLVKEMELKSSLLGKEPLKSIYLGGGTPSLLSEAELDSIFNHIHKNFRVETSAEITLEANPDDLSEKRIQSLRKTPVNRLSIGVQSFSDEELKWMNRAHLSGQSEQAVKLAQDYGFNQISIDLIYGIPVSSHRQWAENLSRALALHVNHISSYCLTVEEKTALAHQIDAGKSPATDDAFAHEQFLMLVETLAQNGYEQYEISNFARNQQYAVHNTSYWKNEPYLGIGPSAHSYDRVSRSWNISNNQLYMQRMEQGLPTEEKEILTIENRFNEYLMTGLRTMWGCEKKVLQSDYHTQFKLIEKELAKKIDLNQIEETDTHFWLTKEARFFADGIAADLFV